MTSERSHMLLTIIIVIIVLAWLALTVAPSRAWLIIWKP
jgi:hypothetical protein